MRSSRTLVAWGAAAITTIAAPAAHAAAGDLDPGFGTGGLARLGADTRSAQSSPVVQADGKVVVAGYEDTPSGRLFLARLTPSGQTDPSFGSGGRVLVGDSTAYRSAALTQAPDGKLVLVSGQSGGKAVISRFSASGALDSTWNAGGKVSVSLGGSSAVPTAVVAQSDGRITFAAASDGGGSAQIAVVRVKPQQGGLLSTTPAQLDPTFDGDGVARLSFGDKISGAFALAQVAGKYVLAGGTGDANFRSGSDTVVARLTSAGALDTTFGAGGKVRTDVSGAGGFDVATGMDVAATGAVTVAGWHAGGRGYVARYTSTGVLDSTFGAGGLLTGALGPAGRFTVPSEVRADPSGRLVVTMTSYAGSTADLGSRWHVARLKAAGVAPMDGDFGAGGRVTIAPCESSGVAPITGLAAPTATRIVVAGSCGPDGQVTAGRLTTSPALPGAATLTATAATEAAGRERIPLSALDPTSVMGSTTALQSTPVRSSPVRSSPVRSSPVRSSPVRSSPVRSSVLLDPSMPPLTLAAVPVRSSSWPELLAGTTYADAPLQAVTLQQVFALDPLPAKLAALSLSDIEVESTPVRSSSLAAYLLGRTTLSKLPAPGNGWPSGVDPATTTLFALEQRGYDLSDYLGRPLSLKRPTDIAGSTLAQIRLVDVALDRTPFGRVPAQQVGAVLSCGSSCTGTVADRQAADPTGFSTRTLGDLIALVPVAALDDVSLGQVIAGLLSPADIPYERAPVDELLAAATLRADDLQTFRVGFDADCVQVGGTSVEVTLPSGARLVPGSAAAGSKTLGDPVRGPDGTLTFTGFAGTCSGDAGAVELTFEAEPGPDLGPASARATVRNGAESQGARAEVIVDDSRDAPATEAAAHAIDDDALVAGHISSASDVDLYRFRVTQPGTVTFTLSGLTQDDDLVVYGADPGLATAPVRSSPVRSSPVRSSTVTDALNERTDAGTLPPNTVQDLPVRSSPVRSSSTRRDLADEAATVRVRPSDVGQDLFVQVTGFNGGVAKEKYVLRAIEDGAPPPLPCAPRPSLQTGTPGTFPTLPLAGDTEALVVIDQRRMAARYGAAATAALVTKLRAFAARPDVKGAVVPVEADPTVDVDAAMAAWDADPCSPAKANAAAAKVNAVVDHVRKDLPGLRHLVLVGPDDVLPQVRVPDGVSLANESEAADDLAFGGQDNAVSRALREGNVLSDDPYGDLDPEVRGSGTLYVPDLAVGRLVETPEQIAAQVDRFVDNEGRLDPRSAKTYGYDFLKDGSAEVDAALRSAVPQGGASSRIDDGWDAQDAKAALSGGGAAFLSINAHYDHHRLLPAAAFFESGAPDLLRAGDITPPPGSVAFTMGCHAGLNVADVLVSGPSDATHDWVQRFTTAGSLYAANTGYGYGDTETVAYSERLMAGFARGLAGKAVTAGQALMFAKQQYAGGLGISDEYDRKALHEAAFYGLPMYRLGPGGGQGAAALPREPAPSSVVATSTTTLTPALDDVPTPRGTYWTADGKPPRVTQQRPIQPRTDVDVTAEDGLPVHGVLVTALRSTDVPDVDGVFATPTVDRAATAPEEDSDAMVFPASLATVGRIADPAKGLRDVVDVAAGQFRDGEGGTGGRGTQRLFTEVGLRTLRGASDDWTPPAIRQVDTLVAGGAAVFTVELVADDGKGGLVLYRTDADEGWRAVPLARAAKGRMGGGTTLPAGATRVTEWYAQVHDGLNVAVSLNKGVGYTGEPLSAPSAGDPKVQLSPAPPASGYYTASPTIGLDPGEHGGQQFEVSVDGGEFRPYTTPFTLPADTLEGGHTVAFRGEDGATALTAFAVDATGPSIVGRPRSAPNAAGWYRDDVVIDWECADATSGVASCPGPSTIATEGAGRSASATATDRAGRSTTGTVSGINLDKSAPTASITSSGLLLFGEVQGNAADTLSGVATVSVTFDGTPRAATVTCSNAARTSCTWSVKPPSSGIFTVQAIVTDRVGREGRSSQSVLTIG